MNNINPLGKTYKEYQEELEKVNLEKSYKVELGLAQDLEKAFKKSDSLVKKSKKLVDKMEKLFYFTDRIPQSAFSVGLGGDLYFES